MEHIINPVYYQDFILAGNAEFTLKSLKTGNKEIFVVKKSRHDRFYFVMNRIREYLGKIELIPQTSENVWDFDRTVREAIAYQDKQIEIFGHFWSLLLERMVEPERFKIQVINHTGRCGHCHRPLTHPESIPIGIGPDCFKKLGLEYKSLKKLPNET